MKPANPKISVKTLQAMDETNQKADDWVGRDLRTRRLVGIILEYFESSRFSSQLGRHAPPFSLFKAAAGSPSRINDSPTKRQ